MRAKDMAALAVAALLAGCSPGSSAATASPGAQGSAAAVGTPPATQHVTAGPLRLDIPTTWHTRAGGLNPGGNVTLVFAGPVDLPTDCPETAPGGTCSAWPVMRLASDGIVVAIRLYGQPGSVPPSGGSIVTVAGLAAHEITGPADAPCMQIGGSKLIQVVLPAMTGTSGYLSIDACIAGGDAAAENTFSAIVASVSVLT